MKGHVDTAIIAAMSWFGCDNRKSKNMSVSISHVSVEFFLRPRLVSVLEEFPWSGEWLINHDIQCFPGGHLSTGCAVSEFAMTVTSAIYTDLASH